jgi:predicted RNase H-like HicB family nuclease
MDWQDELRTGTHKLNEKVSPRIGKEKNGHPAYIPGLPGVIATGKTRTVVEKNIFEATRFHLEGLKEEKIRIPKAQADSEVFVFAI